MLVSHLKKFIYTKTLKTAGTSIEAYFERYCVEQADVTAAAEYRGEAVSAAGIVGARTGNASAKNNEWWNHMPAFEIRKKLGAEMFDSYFKFCGIRNPFDKVLSAFYWYEGIGQSKAPKHLPDPERFEAWLALDAMPGDKNKYLINGNYVMNDVIRYESMAADTQRICGVIGVPWEPERMPAFKTGVRSKAFSTAQMYTPKARAHVERMYAFELDFFKYEFPSTEAAAA